MRKAAMYPARLPNMSLARKKTGKTARAPQKEGANSMVNQVAAPMSPPKKGEMTMPVMAMDQSKTGGLGFMSPSG